MTIYRIVLKIKLKIFNITGRIDKMNNIGINDVTIGFDASAAADYLSNLNNLLVNQTKEKLDDLGGIEAALQNGWQGVSQENFMANLVSAKNKVESTLDELELTLKSQFASISEAWQEQDVDMVPLDD